MHKTIISLYASLLFSLILHIMGLYLLSALLMGITLCTCFGLYGHKSFLVMTFVAVLAVYLVNKMSITAVVIICAMVIPTSFLIGLGLNKNKTFAWTVIPAIFAQTFAFAALLYLEMRRTDSSAVTLLFGDVIEDIKSLQHLLPASFKTEEIIELLYVEMDLILPALIVISSSIISLSVYVTSIHFMRKSGKRLTGLPSFSQLYLSRGFAGVYMIFLLIAWAVGTDAIALNVYLVLSSMFVFCGISVCSYWLSKTRLPKVSRIIVLFFSVLLSLLLVFPMSVWSIMGLIDSNRNFRKLKFEAGRLVEQ